MTSVGNVSSSQGAQPSVPSTEPVDAEQAAVVPVTSGQAQAVGDDVVIEEAQQTAEEAKAAADKATNERAATANNRRNSQLFQVIWEMQDIMAQKPVDRDKLKQCTIRARDIMIRNLRYGNLDAKQQEIFDLVKVSVKNGKPPQYYAAYHSMSDEDKMAAQRVYNAATKNFAKQAQTTETLVFLVNAVTNNHGLNDFSEEDKAYMTPIIKETYMYLAVTDGNSNEDEIRFNKNRLQREAVRSIENTIASIENKDFIKSYKKKPVGADAHLTQAYYNALGHPISDGAAEMGEVIGFNPKTGKRSYSK